MVWIKHVRAGRRRRHARIRKLVCGTAVRPRLCVFRSLKHIYAQVVDDESGHTLASASTRDSALGSGGGVGANVASAKLVGTLVGQRALEKGVKAVVFDRGGYQYHGRVAALADAARGAGLEF